MKILALEKDGPRAGKADINPHLAGEARAVWELMQQELIREIYFRADRGAAVLILECPGVQQAEEALSSLPLVAEGFVNFDLIPLKPYPGLARLFAE